MLSIVESDSAQATIFACHNFCRVQQTLARIEEAPAVRTLRSIQERALVAGASDVHLEPRRDGGRVRLRIDGLLREIQVLDGELFALVTSRVKLLAGMDIADKRQPQDGRYTIESSG